MIFPGPRLGHQRSALERLSSRRARAARSAVFQPLLERRGAVLAWRAQDTAVFLRGHEALPRLTELVYHPGGYTRRLRAGTRTIPIFMSSDDYLPVPYEGELESLRGWWSMRVVAGIARRVALRSLGADRYEILLVPYEEMDRAKDPELRIGWMDAKGRAAELIDLPSLRRLYERAEPRSFPVFDLSDDEWSSLMAQFEGAFRTYGYALRPLGEDPAGHG